MRFRIFAVAALSALLAAPALADKPDDWAERHPLGAPLDRDELRFIERDAFPDLPPPAPGARYAVIDGVVVELDEESYRLLQVLRDVAGVGPAAGLPDQPWAQEVDIPRGHYPPPGRCRVWYPDRPPGQQPSPTSCDVAVPEGAVLVGR